MYTNCYLTAPPFPQAPFKPRASNASPPSPVTVHAVLPALSEVGPLHLLPAHRLRLLRGLLGLRRGRQPRHVARIQLHGRRRVGAEQRGALPGAGRVEVHHLRHLAALVKHEHQDAVHRVLAAALRLGDGQGGALAHGLLPVHKHLVALGLGHHGQVDHGAQVLAQAALQQPPAHRLHALQLVALLALVPGAVTQQHVGRRDSHERLQARLGPDLGHPDVGGQHHARQEGRVHHPAARQQRRARGPGRQLLLLPALAAAVACRVMLALEQVPPLLGRAVAVQPHISDLTRVIQQQAIHASNG
mmetsp:Transcript_2144/g.5442  ORF Transcript_2144/g.5442 Transcript_2144/m.5442 type:complete len:302 (-) Transcript_2144:520-1425(-)